MKSPTIMTGVQRVLSLTSREGSKGMGADLVKEIIQEQELDNVFKINGVVNVWSDGKKIRRWAGQSDASQWHNPKDGYKKMVAILVEVDEG